MRDPYCVLLLRSFDAATYTHAHIHTHTHTHTERDTMNVCLFIFS